MSSGEADPKPAAPEKLDGGDGGMRARYRKDLSKNFMILDTGNAETEDNYQLRTLFSNRIEGLLPLSFEHVDNVRKCRYEITGFQPFAACCESFGITAGDLKKLFLGLISLLDRLEDYLLDPDHLLLDPEYLYADWQSKEIKAAYLPETYVPVREGIRNLTEYMLTRASLGDTECVLLLCGVLKSLRDTSLQIGDIRNVFSAGAKEVPESFPQYEKAPETSRSMFSEEDVYLQDLCKEPEAYKRPEDFDHSPCSSTKASPVTGFSLRKYIPEAYTVILAAFMAAAAAIVWIALRLQDAYILSTPEMAAAAAAGALLIFLCAFITDKASSRFSRKAAAQYTSNSMDSPSAEDTDIAYTPPAFSDWAGDAEGSVYAWAESTFTDPEDGFAGGQTVLLSGDMPAAGSIPASLVPANKDLGLPSFVLDERDLLIGQKSSLSDRVIPDPTISRVHAKITVRNGRFLVSDMGSKNGTSVDGKPVIGRDEVPLTDGSRIMFAGCEYIFHEGRSVVK